jgi:hypothetical protein
MGRWIDSALVRLAAPALNDRSHDITSKQTAKQQTESE